MAKRPTKISFVSPVSSETLRHTRVCHSSITDYQSTYFCSNPTNINVEKIILIDINQGSIIPEKQYLSFLTLHFAP